MTSDVCQCIIDRARAAPAGERRDPRVDTLTRESGKHVASLQWLLQAIKQSYSSINEDVSKGSSHFVFHTLYVVATAIL